MKIIICGDIYFDRELNVTPVFEYLQQAECVIGNLEAPFTANRPYPPSDKTAHLSISSSLATQLSTLNLSAVTLANNHMMDYGAEALDNTLDTLDNIGIRHTGAGASQDKAMRPLFLDLGPLRIAILSFATTLPPNYQATSQRPGVAGIRVRTLIEQDLSRMEEEPGSASQFIHTEALASDMEKPLETIRDAAKSADLVLVGMHWGVSLGYAPEVQGQLATYQEPMADAMLEAGADLIFGGHPHVINGIRATDGGIVGYSQGNFVWHTTHWTPGRPIPPYRSLSLFVNDYIERRKEEGYFIEISIDTDGKNVEQAPQAPAEISIVPYLLNESQEPFFPGVDDAEAILHMIERFTESDDLSSRWTIKNGRAYLPERRLRGRSAPR